MKSKIVMLVAVIVVAVLLVGCGDVYFVSSHHNSQVTIGAGVPESAESESAGMSDYEFGESLALIVLAVGMLAMVAPTLFDWGFIKGKI